MPTGAAISTPADKCLLLPLPLSTSTETGPTRLPAPTACCSVLESAQSISKPLQDCGPLQRCSATHQLWLCRAFVKQLSSVLEFVEHPADEVDNSLVVVSKICWSLQRLARYARPPDYDGCNVETVHCNQAIAYFLTRPKLAI